jgi:hypothetical protein
MSWRMGRKREARLWITAPDPPTLSTLTPSAPNGNDFVSENSAPRAGRSLANRPRGEIDPSCVISPKSNQVAATALRLPHPIRNLDYLHKISKLDDWEGQAVP